MAWYRVNVDDGSTKRLWFGHEPTADEVDAALNAPSVGPNEEPHSAPEPAPEEPVEDILARHPEPNGPDVLMKALSLLPMVAGAGPAASAGGSAVAAVGRTLAANPKSTGAALGALFTPGGIRNRAMGAAAGAGLSGVAGGPLAKLLQRLLPKGAVAEAPAVAESAWLQSQAPKAASLPNVNFQRPAPPLSVPAGSSGASSSAGYPSGATTAANMRLQELVDAARRVATRSASPPASVPVAPPVAPMAAPAAQQSLEAQLRASLATARPPAPPSPLTAGVAPGGEQAEIVAQLRRLSQMPNGRQQVKEIAEATFGPEKAKEILAMIQAATTRMP